MRKPLSADQTDTHRWLERQLPPDNGQVEPRREGAKSLCLLFVDLEGAARRLDVMAGQPLKLPNPILAILASGMSARPEHMHQITSLAGARLVDSVKTANIYMFPWNL